MENQSIQFWSGHETVTYEEEDPFHDLFPNQLSPLHFSGYYPPLNWEWDWEFPIHESLFDPIPLIENLPTYPLMKTLPTNGEDLMKETVLYGNSNREGGEDLRKDKRKRSDREQKTNGSSELTREAISSYFYMPITQAAKELNVGLTLLKKRCRELGINRWPHRKLMSLQTLIKNIQELREEGEESEAHLREAVELLEQERKLMEEMPDLQLEEKTKKLRQACFKANYKKRKLREGLDLGLGSSQEQLAMCSNTSSLMFL
ncbi:protein RKD1-like [Telopea speciosissima]|uniref:protein RKD1-like n=1 Tax=Telopea speciosissima TaxID=54955 RepID=UPI001CC77198|nr:protein RKD1-like [Telopea speciosissima]